MSAKHPSVSAIGSHLDDLFDTAAPAEGHLEREEDRPMEKVTRAVMEIRKRIAPPSEADVRTEEAMHLGR